MRYLLVDDDPQSLRIMALKLGAQLPEHEIQTAASGAEALELIGAGGFDLVVLDVRMPRMNGYEVCRRMREAGATRDIPVIFMTASEASSGLVAEAFELGCVEFLDKTADGEELAARIRNAVEPRADLAEKSRLLESITEGITDEVLLLDRQLHVLWANRAAEDRFRGLGGPMIGRHCYEVSHRRDTPCMGTDCPCPLQHVLATGSVQKSTHKHYDGTGREFFVEVSCYPVRDESGAIQRFVHIGRDITRERDLEAQLLQAQKLEDIGRLAGGVAHDFNNVLGVILGYSRILLAQRPEGDVEREDIQEIVKAADRAASLTRQLLAFSRKQVLEMVEVDLDALVGGLEKLLRRLIGEDIELVVVLGADQRRVLVDPGQFEQVLINLAVNSRDAMPGGGRLTIETRPCALSAERATAVGVESGPYVLIRVEDDGCGMDENTLAHAFDPFFTTKEVGKGTGLGLSVVYGVVKQIGGHIEAQSEVGKGAEFRIYLPEHQGSGASASREPVPCPDRTKARGRGTILLVEDDSALRRLVERLLRSAGYEVLSAAGPGDAILVCEEHPGVIDLLLTDMVMPRMNGVRLADRLVGERPGMKLLFMTGYTDESVDLRGIGDRCQGVLRKPFTEETLVGRVREALGESGAEKPVSLA